MLMARRHRAMLSEMGIQVWQPEPQSASATISDHKNKTPAATDSKIATKSVAASARIDGAKSTFDAENQPLAARESAKSKTTPLVPDNAYTQPLSANPASNTDAWRIGAVQTLYNTPEVPKASRWLLLIESAELALQSNFDAFEGDAGKLLDNMLRAAKLHTTADVMLAPLVRSSPTSGDGLSGQLAMLLQRTQPHVVLVMGRLASQAVLQSAEPLARLRGQVHNIHTVKTVITLDPAYLLRNPLDKAKAWDDLCLALSIAGPSRLQIKSVSTEI